MLKVQSCLKQSLLPFLQCSPFTEWLFLIWLSCPADCHKIRASLTESRENERDFYCPCGKSGEGLFVGRSPRGCGRRKVNGFGYRRQRRILLGHLIRAPMGVQAVGKKQNAYEDKSCQRLRRVRWRLSGHSYWLRGFDQTRECLFLLEWRTNRSRPIRRRLDTANSGPKHGEPLARNREEPGIAAGGSWRRSGRDGFPACFHQLIGSKLNVVAIASTQLVIRDLNMEFLHGILH